ncbi:glycosyltransferase family 29 protein [Sphingobacterium corticibacterium]|uniref:Uncharacterized protein n=1 Tax=Sphingobacterium corticibacterium TaxID=2484746 RepID=A0A4Q6XVG2_9SPHI|nr:glycosyltransferase family 29 protein [Sphingobacterium corticibacterium]RZF61672.1 hypothetical protein EWE74_02185 [Sphingobacterium corticibacterium]
MDLLKRILNRLKYDIQRFWHRRDYECRILIPFDENWFKGKRVALVGGADSVLKEKLGAYIDGFDVVVRINRGVEVLDKQKDYVGSRTDFLFHLFQEGDLPGDSPVTPKLWEEKNVGVVVFSLNVFRSSYGFFTVKKVVERTKKKFRFAQVVPEHYKANAEVLHPFPPTTGFVAINTIMQCMPEELYLTGITFFKTAHNAAYRSGDLTYYQDLFRNNGIHNPELEYRHVKNLYLSYPDVLVPDNTLREIFETN